MHKLLAHATLILVGCSLLAFVPSASATPTCVGEETHVCANGTSKVWACYEDSANDLQACGSLYTAPVNVCVSAQGQTIACSRDAGSAAEPYYTRVVGIVDGAAAAAGDALDNATATKEYVYETVDDVYGDPICSSDDPSEVEYVCVGWNPARGPYVCTYGLVYKCT